MWGEHILSCCIAAFTCAHYFVVFFLYKGPVFFFFFFFFKKYYLHLRYCLIPRSHEQSVYMKHPPVQSPSLLLSEQFFKCILHNNVYLYLKSVDQMCKLCTLFLCHRCLLVKTYLKYLLSYLVSSYLLV